jgi:hypothetical protein
MLVSAAAARWKEPAVECRAADGLQTDYATVGERERIAGELTKIKPWKAAA